MLEECSLVFSCQTWMKSKKRRRGEKRRKEEKKNSAETSLQSSLRAVECRKKIRETRSSLKEREYMQQLL